MVAGWLLSGMGVSSADTLLPDSSFEDWSAVVREVDLADGSVLFEYTARTFSGRVEGAMLAISFVPRFDCKQTVHVRMRNNLQAAPVDRLLDFSIGPTRLKFTGLVDEVGHYLYYSVAATADDIDELLQLIADYSRATIYLASDSTDEAASAESLNFSLLGSRLSTQATQRNCESHVPVAYERRQ